MPATAKHHPKAFVPPSPPFESESVIDDTGHVYMKHMVPDAVRHSAASMLLEHLRRAPMPDNGKGGAELLREAREERARRYGV